MWRGKQNSLSPKLFEVARAVIHQDIGIDDVLVPAKHNLAGRNKREIFLQPLVLRVERGRNFHGGAGDVHIMITRELQQRFPAAFDQIKVGEKSVFVANA